MRARWFVRGDMDGFFGLALAGQRALEAVGRRLGLTADARGLVRLAISFVVVYAAFSTYPPRGERELRWLYNWVGVAALLVLFGRGAQQMRALAPSVAPGRVLAGGFVAMAIAAAFIPPFHSEDVHAYVNVGHVQHHYGANPYVTVPEDLPDWHADEMLDARWHDVPCTYGFLYAATCRAVVAAAGEDPARARLLFKALGALSIALCGWLLATTMRRFGGEAPAMALYLFVWNPYVHLHFISNAHNDLLMALCLLVALRLALADRWPGVVPALVAGMLLKHVAAVALPFALVWLVRRHGWSRALLGTALGAALVVPAAWPYVGDWASFRWDSILGLLTSPWNSLQGAIGTLYEWVAGLFLFPEGSVEVVRNGLRVLFAAGFLLFAVHRFVRAARRADYDAATLIEDALVTLFVLLCVASSAWLPWYLGMFLPAVFLLPARHWVRRLTVWIGAFQLLAFTGIGKARVLQAAVTLALPMYLYWRTRPARPPETETT